MAVKKIEYHGEYLALGTIAKKEGLSDVTLARYYERLGNIYTAVKLCRQNSRGKAKKIEYYGENLSISAIAKREKIANATLTMRYKEIGNIYIAVKKCKEKAKSREERAQLIESKKIEYKGQRVKLKEIAKMEDLDDSELRKYFKDIKDINKAIFMTKYQTRKSQTVHMEDITLDLYDLSLLIGVRYRDLVNLLNTGISINQIKEKYVNQYPGENIKFEDGTTLLEFCVNKGLNYTYMYRAIHTYGKKQAEVEKEIQESGNLVPISWIHERYNRSLEMLELAPFQQTAIIQEISKRKLSLEEAVENCILRKNARMRNISMEWADALYSLVKTRRIIGNEFQGEIHINENEMQFINDTEIELSGLSKRLQTSKTAKIFQKDDKEQDL